MKTISEISQPIVDVLNNFEKMSRKDQLMFLAAYSAFSEVCDDINRRYDGRDARMRSVIDMLRGLK